MKTKKDLLVHYARREPKAFTQIDIHMPDPDNAAMPPDADGDWISIKDTEELMRGAYVRALIVEGADPKAVARQLRKMAVWVEQHADWFKSNAEQRLVQHLQLFKGLVAEHAEEPFSELRADIASIRRSQFHIVKPEENNTDENEQN